MLPLISHLIKKKEDMFDRGFVYLIIQFGAVVVPKNAADFFQSLYYIIGRFLSWLVSRIYVWQRFVSTNVNITDPIHNKNLPFMSEWNVFKLYYIFKNINKFFTLKIIIIIFLFANSYNSFHSWMAGWIMLRQDRWYWNQIQRTP